jgi:hypothetical protein
MIRFILDLIKPYKGKNHFLGNSYDPREFKKKFKTTNMSVEQVKQFTEGLQKLSDEFRKNSEAEKAEYEEEVRESAEKYAEVAPQVNEAAQQFETASHDFAQDMINLADKYVQDVDALYKSIYGNEEA